jgi:hypothetical protein
MLALEFTGGLCVEQRWNTDEENVAEALHNQCPYHSWFRDDVLVY